MAVTKFGPTYYSLCGKTVGASAVASAGLVGSLKHPLLAGSGRSSVKLVNDYKAARSTQRYEPYVPLVGESAKAVGIEETQAEVLVSRWSELTPWPEAVEIVAELASTSRVGVITNCSEKLGVKAANRFGVKFDVFLTAERARYYKPEPMIYVKAIEEIGAAPERILYVAGSPYDVRGATSAGMPVYWHNRIGLIDTEASSMRLRPQTR